jgi:hypothetical protein
MKFIELTVSKTGTKVLVNLDRVSEIEPNDSGGSRLFYSDEEQSLFVTENYSVLSALLLR